MFKTKFLALLMILLSIAPTRIFADNLLLDTPVCVRVNGHYLKTENPAFLYHGTTIIPLRAVSDALGANSIKWNEKTGSAEIKKENQTLVLTKNSKTALQNGKKVSLDTAAIIYKDRFYVPLRFIAESFQTGTEWDKSTYTVHIKAPSVTVPARLIGTPYYSDEDLYWLSRIVHAESKGEPMKGKIGVANVVLNRVESPLYDNTVKEVVFDRKYGIQFTPTANGTIYETPLGDSVVAAKRALLGENHAGKSLYFLNPKLAESFWIVNNRTFYKTIGNHDFYL